MTGDPGGAFVPLRWPKTPKAVDNLWEAFVAVEFLAATLADPHGRRLAVDAREEIVAALAKLRAIEPGEEPMAALRRRRHEE